MRRGGISLIRIRLIILVAVLHVVSIKSVCAEPVSAGSYLHPDLTVEWLVRTEDGRLLLTGTVRNTSQKDMGDMELIARISRQDLTEMGRERFLFIPKVLPPGSFMPFGLFFRMTEEGFPTEIFCTVFLGRDDGSGEVRQVFYSFAASVPPLTVNSR